MSSFNITGQEVFGKYCKIAYGYPIRGVQDYHIYKCIKIFESNSYCDTPITYHTERNCRLHPEVVPVMNVIHCGIDESEVIRVAVKDVEFLEIEVSDDCIDRYSALAELDPRSYEYKAIKELPSVVPKPKEGEWISCSERLPERLERVLVTRANGRVEETFKWNNKEYPWRGGYDDVIAWMPLPKPWKGADDVER